jgi:rhodanese-related sulfurtransferase
MSGRQTIEDLLAHARARLDRLEPSAALRAQKQGAILIDLRCGDDRRASGIIPGSVHVPLSVLMWRLDPTSGYHNPRLADPAKQVVVLCADGYSSSLAAATLQDLGFARATDVIGGFNAWVAAGLPVEPATDDASSGYGSPPPTA